MLEKNILYIIVCIILSCCTSGYGELPIFANSPEDAVVLAESSSLDVLLIFTAPWCPSCVTMKNDLHNNLHIIANKIVCYVDYDKSPDMVKEYKVKIIPSYFLYNHRIEKKRGSGYRNITKFQKWLENDN